MLFADVIMSRSLRQVATSESLIKQIENVLDKHKAADIVTIALDPTAGHFADYMVIASGSNPRHVKSLADKLIRRLKGSLSKPIGIEGMAQCNWVLLDGGDVIIHIFRPEVRAFYKLEKLWSGNGARVLKHTAPLASP